MGNSQDSQNICNHAVGLRHPHLSTQNQHRHSQGGLAKHRTEKRPTVQPARMIPSPSNSLEKEGGGSKNKRYLSLSKAVDVKQSVFKQSRCASLNKQKILLTHPSQTTVYGMSRVINFESRIGLNGSNAAKNSIIKPRDLPRYSSHKVIPTINQNSVPIINIRPPPVYHRPVPMQPPYSYPPEPIQIKFSHPPQECLAPNRKNSSLQASTVTPFKPNTLGEDWFNKPVTAQNISKKLKKVALSRSYIVNDQHIANQNNQEEALRQDIKGSQTSHNTTNTKSLKTSTDIPDSDKEKQNIFTDPKLLSYIADHHRHVPMKQSESKYALAYEADGFVIQYPMTLEEISGSMNTEKKYAVGQWAQYRRQRLQDKVEREVQSKQVIEQSFHFPTATDISEEERSDNTSFVPIRRREFNVSNSSNPFNNEQVLQYCKPRINERVLADLLKLPLKH